MRMLILIAMFLTANPPRVVCPIDNIVVGWTGRTREVKGKTECQYQHVWIHRQGSLFVDEPHIIWAPCHLEERQ